MVFKKRGQGTGAIVTMMVIIAVFVTIYIMVLPDDERNSLFDSLSEEDTTISAREDLLSVSPQRLDYVPDNEIEHNLPSFRIYTKRDVTTLADENIYLQSTLLSKTKKDLSFIVDNVDFVENLVIGGFVRDGDGEIRAYLNDELIYSGDNIEGNLGPLTISKEFLERNNILTLEVANPGIAFWRKDYYDIDLSVVLNEKDIDNQISANKFYLNTAEKNNLEYLEIDFDASCDRDRQSTLKVLVNNKMIYSSTPTCDGHTKFRIYANDVNEGENDIAFKIDEGDYDVYNVMLTSRLKTVDYPTYYFELSKEEIEDIEDDKLFVKAKIEFLDTVETKKGELIINNGVEGFDQDESDLIVDISDDVKIGNNGIQIKPLRSLDIRQMTVYFE